MSLLAGTINNKHFSVKDRQTLTLDVETIPGHVTIAFWDQAQDGSHNVMLIPRDQFDRAIQAYLGEYE